MISMKNDTKNDTVNCTDIKDILKELNQMDVKLAEIRKSFEERVSYYAKLTKDPKYAEYKEQLLKIVREDINIVQQLVTIFKEVKESVNQLHDLNCQKVAENEINRVSSNIHSFIQIMKGELKKIGCDKDISHQLSLIQI